MKQDDEFDQVRVGLLPERFLAPAVQIVKQGCDAVSQSVGVQVIVQRIVPVQGMEADLDIIVGRARAFPGSR